MLVGLIHILVHLWYYECDRAFLDFLVKFVFERSWTENGLNDARCTLFANSVLVPKAIKFKYLKKAKLKKFNGNFMWS